MNFPIGYTRSSAEANYVCSVKFKNATRAQAVILNEKSISGNLGNWVGILCLCKFFQILANLNSFHLLIRPKISNVN